MTREISIDLLSLYSSVVILSGGLLSVSYKAAIKLFSYAIHCYSEVTLRAGFSMQNLVENAVKHNVGTSDAPLLITIGQPTPDELTVENERRPGPVRRSSGTARKAESLGIGLQNLRKQYAILSDRSIQIEQTGSHFRVTLPLLAIAAYERSTD